LKISETGIIERFFRDLGAKRPDVLLGIGDDAALLEVSGGEALVLTTDSLVEGVHFLPGMNPEPLGTRSLAVNLSDIAAMGARPAWALLSLVLPRADESWLEGFARGFGESARAHGVALVGGNLSRGPLAITVQLAGLVPRGQALTRAGGHPGDVLFVSGTPGDAALGLEVLRGARQTEAQHAAYLRARFERPTPRVDLGVQLRGIASACIDVSDGLYVDAIRLARASGCGLRLETEALPHSRALREILGEDGWRGILGGGDDYELCFAVPPGRIAALPQAASSGVTCTRIGELTDAGGIDVRRAGGVMQFSAATFDHFGS
jgi:thiamine-monophosphate kinase